MEREKADAGENAWTVTIIRLVSGGAGTVFKRQWMLEKIVRAAAIGTKETEVTEI